MLDVLAANPPEPAFDAAWLERKLASEIPLARHLGIAVLSAEEPALRLCAPLAPNRNHQGTAFGGSLFSLAVLTGWAWTTRFLERGGFDADAVVQDSSIHYLAPARGTLESVLEAPAAEAVGRLQRMLERAGRGRIRLAVEVRVARLTVARFEGSFVATRR